MNTLELRRDFSLLEPITGNDEWYRNRVSLRSTVQTHDFNDFMHWPVLVKTMIVGMADYVKQEHLMLSHAGLPQLMEAITEPNFGNPELYHGTSGTLVRQAYHLWSWLKTAGKSIEYLKLLDHIVEFGAGYGPMVYLIHKLGFTGTYTIIDFPEVELLQKHYLKAVGTTGNIRWVDNPPPKADLLIACHSLTEAPIELRDQVLSNDYKHWLIAYAGEFEGVDNDAYFETIDVQKYSLEHFINHRYAIK